MVMERHLAKVQEMVDPICKDKDATNERYIKADSRTVLLLAV